MIKAFTLAQIGAIFAFCFDKLLSCIYKNLAKFLAVIMRDTKHSINAVRPRTSAYKYLAFYLAF